jgi:hypothetical protein
MKLSEFLEYLHENTATAQLGEALADIFALRGVALVPVDVSRRETMRAAS